MVCGRLAQALHRALAGFGYKVLGLARGSGARGWSSCFVKHSEGEIVKLNFVADKLSGSPPGLGGATGATQYSGFGHVGDAGRCYS